MEPLISVIVPVYNVAAYLPRCVDSILAQTYENLEILLVDDGSTDDSGEICEQYAKKDTLSYYFACKVTKKISIFSHISLKING